VKRLLSKRVIGAFFLLVLVLYLLRPGAGWMRARVSNSISQAVGRNVQVGYVRLRFLPRPGFEIDDLLVRDNPAFGAEPLVRAPDVTAAVSLGALLRGRIEIARLSLSEPSLNLTRNSDGKWNLEDLIDRTSHSSLAPTGSAHGIAVPGFPYIEASDARLNFKIGTEKTHFALTNAQLALWQDSENTWGARLQARPIRTDANLTDTGVVNVNGLWRRSAQVHETPIQVSFQWKQAQLGQVSKLLYGIEKAWRGTGLLSGTILGTPDKLKISADASTDDFRRQDVIGGGNLRLAAHCTAEYDPPSREVEDLDCGGPVGGGYVQAKGSASGILLNGEPFAKGDLWLVANRAPAESLINLFQHARPEFPGDVQVNGEVSSTIQVQRTDPQQPVSVQGSGSIDDLEIARAGTDAIGFGTVPFTVSNGVENATAKAKHVADSKRPGRATSPMNNLPPQELRAEFGPINLAAAKAGPLTAQATLTRAGYSGSLHGNATVNRILATAKAVSLPTPPFSGDGTADVSLKFSGEWFGRERPVVVGTAHLHSVRAQIRGVNAPVKIVGADLVIDEKAVTVQNLSAETTDAMWRGSLRIPRPCSKPDDCEIQFKVHSDKLTASSLNNLLNPSQRPKSWYRFLSLGKDQPSYLLQAKASGKIAIDKLMLGNAACSHFTSDLSLDAGQLVLSAFKAECLDGTASGTWTANFATKPPQYSGKGSFDGFSLSTVAKLTHDQWVEGSGRAEYQFNAGGTNWQDLLDSAELTAQFNVSGGTFLHIVLTRDSSPLRAEDFSGSLRLSDRVISFHDAKLTNANEVYTVSGTASFAGALNLKAVTEAAGGYVISGTFAKTRVSAIPNAEASLKP
jgi:uncharacterized protein involved in outer membrane biogenesis